jgi:hypothetical protein
MIPHRFLISRVAGYSQSGRFKQDIKEIGLSVPFPPGEETSFKVIPSNRT